ncbi:hypothetical protein PV08_11992 [Exophiala spinifera]|uniref:DUF7580 domain-containing protein n=1 Tax=Exophiala spinifera TaxID=91928 RepID=A0A0D1Y4N1_9EURO|nr:uncharacterized protein PV08_11992 [Exophiala spinifera]KIW09891.1 hypothetical protein PV08_11992 [Exophiala spinifera]
MVTGIETVGVVLAILPLVVNQLDNYVRGIETLKGFRNKRHRRQLEEYSTRLGTQHAILLNSLEQALEGVVDYEDDISDLINCPLGSSWRNQEFQRKLSRKLDRNYDVFVRTTTEISRELQYLSTKLGWDSATTTQMSWDDTGTVERELRKFKDIFSKSVYNELLSKIENANGALQTLIEQSRRRETTRKHRVFKKKPLLKYKNARKHATNIYNAIVHGTCWPCPCSESHCVHLRIEPQALDEDDLKHQTQEAFVPKIRMVFTSKIPSKGTPLWYWQEVETIPVASEPVTVAPSLTKAKSASASTVVTKRTGPDRRVTFAAIVESTLDTVPWPRVNNSLPPPKQISNMCSALCSQNAGDRLLGSILDRSDPTHQYHIYLTDRVDTSVPTKSLADVLEASAKDSLRFSIANQSLMLSRHDRLSLAATLALSVLQYQGSWLKPQWRIQDILFKDHDSGNPTLLDRVYLSAHDVSPTGDSSSLSNGAETSEGASQQLTVAVTSSSLIRCALLFPLALSLIELSLCTPLSSLQTAEDADPVEAISNLKTAVRVLPRVYAESGCRYGDVVDTCLYWPDTKNMQLDDEEFQRTVFEVVISPLLDDLRDFEGKDRIR